MKICVAGAAGAFGIKHLDAIAAIPSIELQDREFFAAIREGREPNAGVAQCLPAMRYLHRIEQKLQAAD